MVQNIAHNTENYAEESAAPPESAAVSADVLATQVSAGLPSPLPEANPGLSAHLRDLTDRARGYVAAATATTISITAAAVIVLPFALQAPSAFLHGVWGG